MKLLALGGCGGMGRFASRAAAQDEAFSEIVVADLDGSAAEAFVRDCGAESMRALTLDITDTRALHAALEKADVVLNFVGPYFRFGARVLEAAIETGTDYVDINDDWEPTLQMLEFDERAKAQGVTAVLGIGASPGLTNLLAVLAFQELDRVDVLHTIWGIGEDGLKGNSESSALSGEGESDGAALEHWMHQVSGTLQALDAGSLRELRPLQPVEVDYPGIGPVICHSVGHPEPVTFSKSFPGLQRSLNLMDMPRALISLVRRLARRIDRGELTAGQAAGLLDFDVPSGLALLKSRMGWGLLLEAIQGTPHLPELAAYAEGESAGQRVRVGASLGAVLPGGMGGVTGIPAAVGVGMVARGKVLRKGVLVPETAFDPAEFFRRLAPFCSGADPRELVRLVRS